MEKIMRSSLRTLTTISLSALAGLVAICSRSAICHAGTAEEFKPIKEAEMPAGFPTYTPVGKIVIKNYPTYRKATASGTSEFWTLFRHIKENRVQMTTPVEMDYGDPSAAKSKERSMSFLYEKPEQGEAGKQGAVEVSDVPAMTVASIGCRGNQNSAAIAEAREKLLKFLEDKKEEYDVSGPLRVMGYNSPFVPRDKNFFEVQIPVKAAKAE
jgi:hypothetical protein